MITSPLVTARLFVAVGALASIVAAQGLRAAARDELGPEPAAEPFAPSPSAASILSLGYRELAADLLFFRLIGYFGGKDAAPSGVAALVEAIATVDPYYEKIYTWGGRAMVATRGGGNEIAERAVRLLERGAAHFPSSAKIPKLAGEILLSDYEPANADERRLVQERAARFIESAVRKPYADASTATLAATLRTKLGQRLHAIDSLREMILITNDVGARQQLLDKLAELEARDGQALAAELLEARRGFDESWRRQRPAVPSSMFVLVGAPPRAGFDLVELATGGRDLVEFTSVVDPTDP
jgi:hypothetical protein